MAEICPKCGYPEVVTDECPRCRVVVSKYRAYLERLGQAPAKPSEAPTPAPTTPLAQPAGVAAPALEVVGRPAGFWIRFAAVLVDGIFFWVVGLVIRFIARLLWGSDVLEERVMKASLIAFNLLFGAAYYILMHWVWGQTIGKMVLKLRVVTVEGSPISLGTSILRYIGYWLSTVILFIGYLMAGLRPDKRALHDLVAKTHVIRL